MMRKNSLTDSGSTSAIKVVIDDIWDAKAWEIIQLALWNNNSGSRIITTTRSAKVASCCSSQGGYVYQMEALSFADSKRLFYRRAFGSEELCYPHLEKVCHGIMEKCSGLPLALITISSLLVDQVEKDEWKRVLTTIGHALAKNPDAEDMTKILSLSYYDLPRQLRTCFLYLSIFPEDYVIAKERLVNRWIAEGFIHEEQELSAYRIGENYFNDLINRSMIQPIDVEYGQAKACLVHDIILDYIKCKAADENFIASIDSVEHQYTLEYKIRRLCVVNKRNEKKDSIWTSLILSHVRSLSIFGHPIQTSLLSFKALRVLDIEASRGLNDHYITTFIEKLLHLKYLRLCSYLISNLPEEIGELHYLETLDVRGTRIKQLPSTVMKLQRLAHLYVDPRIRFPDGMIGKMKSLKELAEFEVCSYEIGKSMQEFSQLTKLRTLVISWKLYCSFDSRGRQQADLQILVGALISKCNLHNLYIHDRRDNLPWYQPLSTGSWCPTARCTLQKLHITFCLSRTW
ncbi:hypothetical protein PAHAL_6G053600 [Panicum hallii]|uniref:Uncharacterized protein n=1 Tax=Panicum hallii TaxID=206008 RepID=A0A2T8IF87_9POAL|nr:hypothetical protein PAHAL_6G053600 [Panicum hallii]